MSPTKQVETIAKHAIKQCAIELEQVATSLKWVSAFGGADAHRFVESVIAIAEYAQKQLEHISKDEPAAAAAAAVDEAAQ